MLIAFDAEEQSEKEARKRALRLMPLTNRRAREEAAADPLNGQYVTTAKAPEAGIRFTARVTVYGVEIRREDEERTHFELRSAFEHDLSEGYIRRRITRQQARRKLTARPGTERECQFVIPWTAGHSRVIPITIDHNALWTV